MNARKTVYYYDKDKAEFTGIILEGENTVQKVPKGWEKFPDDWVEPPEGYKYRNAPRVGFKIDS